MNGLCKEKIVPVIVWIMLHRLDFRLETGDWRLETGD
jgi:hypothetical protein